MTPASIAALFGVMLVISATPGPSDFAVVARSLSHGFRHGLVMIAGIVAADILFILLAVYSMAAIADRLGGLFLVVKLLCAAGLIWMGLSAMRTRPASAPPLAASDSRSSSFFSGLMITLGDPKAILFYMGLLPAFVNMADLTAVDAVTIMLVATVVIVGVKAGYAWLADSARRFFESRHARRRMDLAAGTVLLSTGLLLLVQAVT